MTDFYYWPWVPDIEAYVFIIVSPIVCFLGERARWISVLVLFYGASCYLVDLYHPGAADTTSTQLGLRWTIWCIVMLIGCIVACCLLRLTVLVVGACVTALLANIAYQMILSAGFSDYLYARLIVLCVFAIVGGAIGLAGFRWALRVFTPFLGGYLFIAAVDHFGRYMGWWKIEPFFPRIEPNGQFFSHPNEFPWSDRKHSALLLVLWALLAALGIMFQCWLEKRRQARKEVLIPDNNGKNEIKEAPQPADGGQARETPQKADQQV